MLLLQNLYRVTLNLFTLTFICDLSLNILVSGALSAVHPPVRSAVLSVWHFRPGLSVCFTIKHYRNVCFSSLALRGAWTCHSPMELFYRTVCEGRPPSAELAAGTACTHKYVVLPFWLCLGEKTEVEMTWSATSFSVACLAWPFFLSMESISLCGEWCFWWH